MDDKGQMLVLETVFFAAMVILALIFLYQLSPSPPVRTTYTYDLKILGDDALRTLYYDNITGDYPSGYPKSKLTYYILTNDYGKIITDLSNHLPDSILFNIYIANETDTMFWCPSLGSDKSLTPTGQVKISHHFITIHPDYLTKLPPEKYIDTNKCDLYDLFPGYTGSTYQVILEMWYI